MGRLLLVLGAASLLLLGAAAYRLHVVTTAERGADAALDFESMELAVEVVELRSADDIALKGWMIRGDPGMPAILLCHDFGSDKSSLINLAIALRKRGFTLLLIDFRGHGESAGSGSTLGLLESRDILGACDLLSRLDWVDSDRIGLYGVGMGAHAGVLAAAEEPGFRVLVLDSLYPDISYELVRRFYGGWAFGVRKLSILPRALFRMISGQSATGQSAAAVIGRLPGRDLLMLAPQEDVDLTAAMKQMYLSIPEQTDVDGNLVIMPRTRTGTLYGEQQDIYNNRVAEFFLSRLAKEPR